MNFGPEGSLTNTGRRDGYYVNAASFQGFEPDGTSGVSVAPAGDVDGDGMDDILIGAPGVKQAYVLFGSSGYAAFRRQLTMGNLNGFDGFKMYGEHAGDCAGYDVAAAGDFNNDGVDDLVVSAMLSNAGEVDGGNTYVIFGSQFDAKLDMIPKKKPDGTYGAAIIADCDIEVVSSAGDFNDDGFEDMALACPSNADGSGTVFIVFGGDAIKASTELSDL
ncbi:hypothetical protein AURANDRAFT_32412, partial [Aureococcus anophagefferens]